MKQDMFIYCYISWESVLYDITQYNLLPPTAPAGTSIPPITLAGATAPQTPLTGTIVPRTALTWQFNAFIPIHYFVFWGGTGSGTVGCRTTHCPMI